MFAASFLDFRETGLRTYDTTAAMNGCLTGLVAITSGCASVMPWAGFTIGVFAGLIYLAASKLLIKLRIDDAVDAIPVHLFGGAWGVLASGLFSKGSLLEQAYGRSVHVGWFYAWGEGSGDFTLLGIQLLSILWIFGWTFATMGVFTYVINFFGLLRVDPLEEEVGLDISIHKGSAYDSEGEAPKASVEKLSVLRLDNSNSSHGKKKAYKSTESFEN